MDKLDKLLKEFYIHATATDDYGCKECLRIKAKIQKEIDRYRDRLGKFRDENYIGMSAYCRLEQELDTLKLNYEKLKVVKKRYQKRLGEKVAMHIWDVFPLDAKKIIDVFIKSKKLIYKKDAPKHCEIRQIPINEKFCENRIVLKPEHEEE